MFYAYRFALNVSAAYSMPSFTVEMKNVRAREGDKAKFKCIYAGNPAPGKLVI